MSPTPPRASNSPQTCLRAVFCGCFPEEAPTPPRTLNGPQTCLRAVYRWRVHRPAGCAHLYQAPKDTRPLCPSTPHFLFSRAKPSLALQARTHEPAKESGGRGREASASEVVLAPCLGEGAETGWGSRVPRICGALLSGLRVANPLFAPLPPTPPCTTTPRAAHAKNRRAIRDMHPKS